MGWFVYWVVLVERLWCWWGFCLVVLVICGEIWNCWCIGCSVVCWEYVLYVGWVYWDRCLWRIGLIGFWLVVWGVVFVWVVVYGVVWVLLWWDCCGICSWFVDCVLVWFWLMIVKMVWRFLWVVVWVGFVCWCWWRSLWDCILGKMFVVISFVWWSVFLFLGVVWCIVCCGFWCRYMSWWWMIVWSVGWFGCRVGGVWCDCEMLLFRFCVVLVVWWWSILSGWVCNCYWLVCCIVCVGCVWVVFWM